jgi:predicted metalloprotease
MRWWGGRESGNVEYGSGGGGRYLVGGGIGTAVIALIIYLLGGNPSQLIQSGPDAQGTVSKEPPGGKDSTDYFISIVLAQTEDVWGKIFSDAGSAYRQPTLRVFDGQVQSACGMASSATGPFYCPGDEKVYLDKSFFRELRDRFHAPGDFASAYVIAHEVGHHVQHLLGTSDEVQQRMQQYREGRQRNRLSVMLELQADFYAGIWAHYMNQRGDVVDPGDLESALNAASAIGDDRLQKQTQGHVVPDAFTHGTSQQRMYWFKKGFETGDVKQGNTFQELATLYTFQYQLEGRLAELGVEWPESIANKQRAVLGDAPYASHSHQSAMLALPAPLH